MNGTDHEPSSPQEALETTAGPGVIVRVFNTKAKVVGYFASRNSITDEPGGFINEAEKDALVAEGYRYVEGRTPEPAP